MANAFLNDRLKQYLAAEKAILVGGQSYRIGNRTLTRADLNEIRSEIRALVNAGATVDETTGGRPRRRARIIPND